MLDLALANALRDLLIGLGGVAIAFGILCLIARNERKYSEQVEQRDAADFVDEMAREADWAWPPKPVQPPAEYVAPDKGRVR